MDVSLTLTQVQHKQLYNHLYPGDGYEAVALVLCGRRSGRERHRLVAREICVVPYDACSVRTADQVTWDAERIIPILERAHSQHLTVVKVHSHPSGYAEFSTTDDDADLRFLSEVQAWTEGDFLHASAVMLPNGGLFGRYLNLDEQLVPLHKITLVGEDLSYWLATPASRTPDFAASHVQAFGDGTYELLSNLSIAVVGCSGTGSPVIEQLARLGVGELLLVDNDVVETRNLNRILNTTAKDVEGKRFKVDVLSEAIERMGLGTIVTAIHKNLWDPEVVKAVAECDVIFGCVDTIDGRYLLNTLATYYLLPYFDLGVRLLAEPIHNGIGEITEVCGGVHYLQPGSSLMSRNVFDMARVSAAGLARNDPAAFSREVQEGYIRGIPVHRPAVISINMAVSALGVNELLARLHPFREERNGVYEHIEISLASMDLFYENYPFLTCKILGHQVGKGDQPLLLNIPELSERVSHANVT